MFKTKYKIKNTHTLILLSLLTVLTLAFLLDLGLGAIHIPIDQVVTILLGGQPEKATWASIVFKFRLPKAITATLAGAALGVSGLQMQTLFRNPLAGPFVLGISSGASLGVAIVVLAVNSLGATALLQNIEFLGDLTNVIAASLGAAAVLSLVLIVSRRVQDTMTLLILGLLFGYATSAVVSILLQFSDNQKIQTYLQWTFGSFAGVTWRQIPILSTVVILGLLVSVFLSKALNVLLIGESYALTLGINLQRARFWILVSASVLAGVITAFCGPIAFLGVAVPHLCRSLLNTSDHWVLTPTVIIMGASLALFADLLCTIPGNQTILPLNSVTALIGTPVVTWVILRRYYS
jgi:iron complex transport system permease protein